MKVQKFILVYFCLVFIFSCDDSAVGSFPNSELPPGTVLESYDNIEDLSRARVYEGDVLIQEGDVLNGLKNGAWTTFDQQGLVQNLTTFQKGVKQGPSIEVDQQGYISKYAFYVNNELSGSFKVYKRRRLIEERTYVEGVLNGPLKKYYDDGTPLEESNYSNGQLDGTAKWYDREGNVSLVYEYDMGELVDEGAEN